MTILFIIWHCFSSFNLPTCRRTIGDSFRGNDLDGFRTRESQAMLTSWYSRAYCTRSNRSATLHGSFRSTQTSLRRLCDRIELLQQALQDSRPKLRPASRQVYQNGVLGNTKSRGVKPFPAVATNKPRMNASKVFYTANRVARCLGMATPLPS